VTNECNIWTYEDVKEMNNEVIFYIYSSPNINESNMKDDEKGEGCSTHGKM
jgi:hypothetical protein